MSLKPLCRGRRVALNDKDEVWVSFKYEKLSNFCYWCGKVSHTDKECEKWLASKGTLTLDQQEYGAWFRAPPHNIGKTRFTKVSGMGGAFGRTQSGKSTSVKDIVGYVHETSGEQPSSVELSDQSHSGVTDVENHQVSNLVSSDLVEDFRCGALTGVNSNFDLVDLVLDLSLIPNQSTNFEFQLEEIDSEIQKFDNDKNPKPENQVICIMVPSEDFIGEDNGNLENPHKECPCEELPMDSTTLCKWKKIARDTFSNDSLM